VNTEVAVKAVPPRTVDVMEVTRTAEVTILVDRAPELAPGPVPVDPVADEAATATPVVITVGLVTVTEEMTVLPEDTIVVGTTPDEISVVEVITVVERAVVPEPDTPPETVAPVDDSPVIVLNEVTTVGEVIVIEETIVLPEVTMVVGTTPDETSDVKTTTLVEPAEAVVPVDEDSVKMDVSWVVAVETCVLRIDETEVVSNTDVDVAIDEDVTTWKNEKSANFNKSRPRFWVGQSRLC
jgi:hypothetical protein